MAVHSGARGAPIWGPAEVLQGYASAPADIKDWTTLGMIDTSVRGRINASVGIRECHESKLYDLRGIEGLIEIAQPHPTITVGGYLTYNISLKALQIDQFITIKTITITTTITDHTYLRLKSSHFVSYTQPLIMANGQVKRRGQLPGPKGRSPKYNESQKLTISRPSPSWKPFRYGSQ
jgi:hypothetical protein